MMRFAVLLRYAARSLRRDATRSFLAILSITVGVLSLVSMQLFSANLLFGPLFDDRQQTGGDAQIKPAQAGQTFNPEELAQFGQWQSEGLLSDYAPLSYTSAGFLRTADNGRVSFVSGVLGIEPSRYPLLGNLGLREPAQATIADLLAEPNAALITREIADERALGLGDTIVMNGTQGPTSFSVRGILKETPNHRGDGVYVSLDGAARLMGPNPVNAVAVIWPDQANALQQIEPLGYRIDLVRTHEQRSEESETYRILDVMFKGAGVMGLLVGGMSVASTLHVMLQRRKQEIAILKTLGFQRRDLLGLICLETGLLGLIGGLLGTAIGTWITYMLFELLMSGGMIMLTWSPHPQVLLGGVLVGVLTAITFGIQAILALSNTRPISILRDLPSSPSKGERIGQVGLYALLMLVCASVISMILGSWIDGIGLVLVGGLALMLLRGLFWLVLWCCLRLPQPFSPILRIAQSSLRKRIHSATLAVIALCVGTYAVSLAVSVIGDAQSTLAESQRSDEGYNLLIFTDLANESAAYAALEAQQSHEIITIDAVSATLQGSKVELEGRALADLNHDVSVSTIWDEQGVLMPEKRAEEYQIGDWIELVIDDQPLDLEVAGFYTSDPEQSILPTSDALIIPRQLARQYDPQIRLLAAFDAAVLDATTTQLGQSLPEALVFSRADLNARSSSSYAAIHRFAISLGGLAFLTGAVLIANSAGLNALQRRREIGILKAVGYGRRQVQVLLLSEYALLGTIAGIFGVIGVVVTVFGLRTLMQIDTITVQPALLSVLLVGSILIAVCSAALVLWEASRLRPLEIFRHES
jgi:putative ABC transport system permease protein